jgi:hypothetical protein
MIFPLESSLSGCLLYNACKAFHAHSIIWALYKLKGNFLWSRMRLMFVIFITYKCTLTVFYYTITVRLAECMRCAWNSTIEGKKLLLLDGTNWNCETHDTALFASLNLFFLYSTRSRMSEEKFFILCIINELVLQNFFHS